MLVGVSLTIRVEPLVTFLPSGPVFDSSSVFCRLLYEIMGGYFRESPSCYQKEFNAPEILQVCYLCDEGVTVPGNSLPQPWDQ